MASKEIVIYCDESTAKGRYYSDFYGGVLVGSNNLDAVKAAIAAKKAELNFHGEVKWTKITENYVQKYIELVDLVFDLCRLKQIKIRIMFTQNMFAAKGLTQEHKDNKYFLLYYQFIKNAFGLRYTASAYNVRIYLDKMPDTLEKVDAFRTNISAIPRLSAFITAKFVIKKENVTEVVSHDHDILQCLDIVLGAIQFRLNDMHKEIPKGSLRRGKRTVAKEKVYKHINSRICEIYPRFNIGVSTAAPSLSDRWRHPYRHWRFISRNHEIVVGGGKRTKKAP